MFKVETILAIFVWIIRALDARQRKQVEVVESYETAIKGLTEAKAEALAEIEKAAAVASNIRSLLNR